jgi:cell division protein FtsW (lipid II flippase)
MVDGSLRALQVVMQAASSTSSTTSRRVAYLPDSHTDFIFSVSLDTFSIVRLAVVVVLVTTLIYVLRRRRRMR